MLAHDWQHGIDDTGDAEDIDVKQTLGLRDGGLLRTAKEMAPLRYDFQKDLEEGLLMLASK
ncbi:MAG: hypothetical protein ABIR76_07210 [Polaromonas sp.]